MTSSSRSLDRLYQDYLGHSPRNPWLDAHKGDIAALLEERGLTIVSGLLDVPRWRLEAWAKSNELPIRSTRQLAHDTLTLMDVKI
mgnify:CR=1 FL=1